MKANSYYSQTKRNLIQFTVKTISGLSIKISNITTSHSILDLKKILCAKSGLAPSDLLIVKNGVEEKDNFTFNDEEALFANNRYVLCRSSSQNKLLLSVFNTNNKAKQRCTVSLSPSCTVSDVKTTLYKSKVSHLRPGEQRIILGKKVLTNNCFLGDYILHALWTKPSAFAPSNSNKDSQHMSPQLSIHVSPTVNIAHEVNVTIDLPNKGHFKFCFAIDTPLINIREILWRQYRVPKDLHISFCLAVSGRSWVPLDPTCRLIDYGITSSAKAVQLTTQVALALKLDNHTIGRDGEITLAHVSEPSKLDSKRKGDCPLFAGMKKGFLNNKSSKK